jgi:predicted AAA+ superfamily ATPase
MRVLELEQACRSLLIYRHVLGDEIGQAFLALLQTAEQPALALDAYSRWFSGLAQAQLGWQEYVLIRILGDENPFTQNVQHENLPSALIQAVEHDLEKLQLIYQCSSKQICEWVEKQTYQQLVKWSDFLVENKPVNPRQADITKLRTKLEGISGWATAIADFQAFYRQFGTGLFAEYGAFRWQNGRFVAVVNPDPIATETLVGYEAQRDTLLKNTEFLLSALPALHILLYGSRGSGKSSLVKSLLGKYRDRNLRLIEVSKSALKDLPEIVEQLRNQPQKFVIFVDDLSFEEDDDAYKALKVVLEGNLTARPQNVVVYATSNRRHLIREFFGDRPRPQDADEVHHWDTMQEKLSFSDRFGLTLTFEPADQNTYLKIIHHLAKQENISFSPEDLQFQALQWATRHNGRSGRTARQFIDFLKADLKLNH